MERVETIGDATLYLGDCKSILPNLAPLDFVFTDPPYGHNNNNGDLIHRWEQALGLGAIASKAIPRPIANDGPIEAAMLIDWFFKTLPTLLKPGCCCCCCCGGGGGPDPQFARWSLLLDQHLDFKQMVVWDKGPMGMGWHYRRSYETVLVAQKPGAACRWYEETKRVENIIRPGDFGIRKIIPGAQDHPTPKPPELARHFIRLHSAPGDTVLDPFMGAGSTGVAAVLEGRSFIGCEIEQKWFDIACRRIEEAYRQRDLFIEPPKQITAKQEAFNGL